MNRMMLRRRVLMASLMNSGLPLSDLPEGSLVAINEKGSIDHDYVTSKLGSRPCFTLPADAIVNPEPNADGSYTLTI